MMHNEKENQQLVNQRIDIAELKSSVNDMSSETVRNVSEINSLRFTLTKQQQTLVEFEKTLENYEKETGDLRKRFNRTMGAFLATILFIFILIFIVFTNGRISHDQTGIDEIENQVFHN